MEVSDAPEAWETKAAAEKEKDDTVNNFDTEEIKAATEKEPEKEPEDDQVEKSEENAAPESGKVVGDVKQEPATSSKKYWLPNSFRRMLGAKDAMP